MALGRVSGNEATEQRAGQVLRRSLSRNRPRLSLVDGADARPSYICCHWKHGLTLNISKDLLGGTEPHPARLPNML